MRTLMQRSVRKLEMTVRGAWRPLALVLILLAAVPTVGRAQETGDGYLFGKPAGQFTLRAGYPRPNANSDLFTDATSQFTLSRSDFSSVLVGAELALWLTPHLDIALGADYAGKTAPSEYRHFVDNNNKPIEQTTRFQRAPLTAALRFYPGSRGRAVGNLAWIPASVAPWIGAGGGAMWYKFRQEGDFISSITNKVYYDHFEASGWRPIALGMAGVDITLTPRIALVADARYIWSAADKLGGGNADYVDYTVDLSGAVATLGLTFRL
jgi:hypothetical protein